MDLYFRGYLDLRSLIRGESDSLPLAKRLFIDEEIRDALDLDTEISSRCRLDREVLPDKSLYADRVLGSMVSFFEDTRKEGQEYSRDQDIEHELYRCEALIPTEPDISRKDKRGDRERESKKCTRDQLNHEKKATNCEIRDEYIDHRLFLKEFREIAEDIRIEDILGIATTE